jgi:hypothetical protein
LLRVLPIGVKRRVLPDAAAAAGDVLGMLAPEESASF